MIFYVLFRYMLQYSFLKCFIFEFYNVITRIKFQFKILIIFFLIFEQCYNYIWYYNANKPVPNFDLINQTRGILMCLKSLNSDYLKTLNLKLLWHGPAVSIY